MPTDESIKETLERKKESLRRITQELEEPSGQNYGGMYHDSLVALSSLANHLLAENTNYKRKLQVCLVEAQAILDLVPEEYRVTAAKDGVFASLAISLTKWLEAHKETLQLLNTPEVNSFREGVLLEAAHQRKRWGSEQDAGKTPADWFWLVGYLAGKALQAQNAGNTEKALHHTISTAAALANWHASILGKTDMRPGLSATQQEIEGA